VQNLSLLAAGGGIEAKFPSSYEFGGFRVRYLAEDSLRAWPSPVPISCLDVSEHDLSILGSDGRQDEIRSRFVPRDQLPGR
jgi:hypothetical protein